MIRGGGYLIVFNSHPPSMSQIHMSEFRSNFAENKKNIIIGVEYLIAFDSHPPSCHTFTCPNYDQILMRIKTDHHRE